LTTYKTDLKIKGTLKTAIAFPKIKKNCKEIIKKHIGTTCLRMEKVKTDHKTQT